MTSLDFSSLSLYSATKEQILEARKRHVHYMMKFKKGWTVEEWLKRDAIMDEYEHARNGRQVAWVLAPRDDPQTLDFPCSCHT
ncbi:hypothetical protein K474DRAFT_1711928 [Panus rudis PR-1116 ss-1]|nr:hypothetical protein K474DRAFT_1711928 [Panus rudis PR-1116 ss-1]